MNRRPHKWAPYLALTLSFAANSVTSQPSTCPFSTEGSLAAGDLDQTGRLLRDGVANTCAVPDPCVIAEATGARDYDVYTLQTNPTGPNPTCVTVTTNTQTCDIFAVAYTTFNPASPCENYLGAPGSSNMGAPSSFSFNVAAGTTFQVVVHAVTPGDSCASYTLAVTGCEVVPVELQHFSIEP